MYTLLFIISMTIHSQCLIYDQPNAKAIAMNSLLIAVEDERSPSLSNPGGLAFIDCNRASITLGNKKMLGLSYAQHFRMANVGVEFFYENFTRSNFSLENKPRTFINVLLGRKIEKHVGFGLSFKLSSDYLTHEHYIFSDVGFLVKTPISGLNIGLCLKELYLKNISKQSFENRLLFGLSYKIPTFFRTSLLFSFEYEKQFLNINEFIKYSEYLIEDAYFSYGLDLTLFTHFEISLSSSFNRYQREINGGIGINCQKFSVFVSKDKTLLPFFGDFHLLYPEEVYLLTFVLKL